MKMETKIGDSNYLISEITVEDVKIQVGKLSVKEEQQEIENKTGFLTGYEINITKDGDDNEVFVSFERNSVIESEIKVEEEQIIVNDTLVVKREILQTPEKIEKDFCTDSEVEDRLNENLDQLEFEIKVEEEQVQVADILVKRERQENIWNCSDVNMLIKTETAESFQEVQDASSVISKYSDFSKNCNSNNDDNSTVHKKLLGQKSSRKCNKWKETLEQKVQENIRTSKRKIGIDGNRSIEICVRCQNQIKPSKLVINICALCLKPLCAKCTQLCRKKPQYSSQNGKVFFCTECNNRKCFVLCDKIPNTAGNPSDKVDKYKACSKVFNTTSDLNYHVKENLRTEEASLIANLDTHHGDSQFECQICSKKYVKKFSLRNHIRSIHLRKPVECPICGKTLSRVTSLQCHMESHNEKAKFKCHHCFRFYKGKLKLQAHIALCHNKYEHTCKFCFISFISKDHLENHMKVHRTRKRSSNCKICHTSYKTKTQLEIHMNSLLHKRLKKKMAFEKRQIKEQASTKEGKSDLMNIKKSGFECAVCGQWFKSGGVLKGHTKTHDEFKCRVCSKVWEVYLGLSNHFRNCHAERKFECGHCGKKFAAKGKMRLHIDSHRTDLIHSCKVCSKQFKTKKRLLFHSYKHDVGEFECEVCLKKYQYKVALQDHQLRMHVERDRFGCTICGNKYKYKAGLRRHMESHNKAAEFKCNQCPKIYKGRKQLREHVYAKHRRHKFFCQFCTMSYIDKWRLERHLKFHNITERPFECKVCGTRYKSKTMFQDHEKTDLHKQNINALQGGVIYPRIIRKIIR